MERQPPKEESWPPSRTADAVGVPGEGSAARFYCLARIAWSGIASFQVQYVLTFLTMAIGAFTLAATLFTTEGALRLLWQDLDRLMGNRVEVLPDPGPNQNLLSRRPSADITTEDYEHVQGRLTGVRYVTPRFFGRTRVVSQETSQILPVDGITEALSAEPAFKPRWGYPFSAAAHNGHAWECLLTDSAVRILELESALDATVRIGMHRFRVVGVIEDPPEADPSFQARVVVPFFVSQLLWGKPGVVHSIVVAWDGAENMESTIARLRHALDECRAPDAYFLSSSDFKVKKRKNIASNFMVFGSTQALFCILVASIGVVNVMLANVVRRMREFAIRVAMGARQGDIVILVLAESALLGLVGGALGVLAAVTSASSFCRFISSSIPDASQLVPYIGTRGILAPLLVCGISGLAAGIIPALRAGRIDMLTVLRAE